MFEYRCKVLRVIDGDTVELDIDLGMLVHTKATCRLYGINAAEMMQEPIKALKALDHLKAMLSYEPIICRTHKDKKGKYGRWLVELENCAKENINAAMVRDGYAMPYVYR